MGRLGYLVITLLGVTGTAELGDALGALDYLPCVTWLSPLRWETLLGPRGADADGSGYGFGGHGGEAIDIRYLAKGKEGEGGASKPKAGVGGAKHGKVDPDGNPHVGGNQWAGGTGGSDTAGLGGRGGPYRLSDGNAVHQVRECSKIWVG